MNDEALSLDLYDDGYLADVKLPIDRYPGPFTDVDPRHFGQPRPFQFGDAGAANAPAYSNGVRVARDASTGYGLYEVSRAQNFPAFPYFSTNQVVIAYSYPNEELAEQDQLGMALGVLDFASDYLTYGTFLHTILRDVRNLRYDKSGNDIGTGCRFDFDIGAGGLTANLDVNGNPVLVAAALQAAMNAAASVANISVVYSETTHKFTVSRASGTLNLRPKSGPNPHVAPSGSWAILGYDTSSDKTGASSYLAERAIFTGPDEDHHIRWLDLGLITPPELTTAFPVTFPALIVPWLLFVVLKVPMSRIDYPSFEAAAQSQFDRDLYVNLTIREETTFGEVLSRLQRAGFMDVILDSDGVWTCIDHLDPAAPVRSFSDVDYLSWEIAQATSEIYKSVRVLYHNDPETNEYLKSYEAVSVLGADVKFGAQQILEWPTDGAVSVASAWWTHGDRLHRLSANVPRVASFSCVGKLLDLQVGDRITLSRSRALDPTGTLSAVVFRILDLSHDYLAGSSSCVAVEDLPYL